MHAFRDHPSQRSQLPPRALSARERWCRSRVGRYSSLIRCCLGLIACGVAVNAPAASSVWKVRSDSGYVYLGGSSHLLRQSDYPLPPEFDTAFTDSAVLVLEADVEGLKDPAVQAQLLAKGQLQGTTLDKVLSPEVYGSLSNHCHQLGLPIALFNGLKPSMVILTATVLELQRLGVSASGVDMHFSERAVAAEKRRVSLESVEEQLDMILALGDGNEDDFVTHSLMELKQTGDLLPELLDAWRSGDLNTLEKNFLQPMQSDYPELYQQLVVDRNHNWLPQIELLLQSKETEFILVGALHLAGDDGLLKALKERGFTVEPLQVDE